MAHLNRQGHQPQTQGVTISIDNADEFFDAFDALSSRVEEAVRPAAQAAAQVFYDEVHRNVDTLGDVFTVTGQLKGAIYQVYSRDNSGPLLAEYHVSWNHTRAPHAHLVEFGHMQPYVVYRDKRGLLHTKVKPERLKEYLSRYHGRTVPKEQRDYFFVRYPGGPKQVPAYPFIRPALAKADEAYRKAADIMWSAVSSDPRIASMQ